MNRNTTPSRLAFVSAFAAIYIIWGSTYLAIRVGIDTVPPFLLAAARFACAGGVLYAWARWRGAPRSTWSEWRRATLIGTLMLCGGNGLVCWAEAYVPSGSAALLVALVPVFMVLLDVFWARRSRLNALTAIGVAAGFAGVALLVTRTDAAGESFHLGGAIALVGAALSWSIGSVVSRQYDRPTSPTLNTAMQMIGGSVSLAMVATVLGEWSAFEPTAISIESLLALLYLISFGSIVALTAYVWLLHHATAASVSTYAFVNPVVALFLGWLFLGETIDGTVTLAGGVIVAGVIMIHTARHGRALPAPHEAPKTIATGPAPVANRVRE